MPYSATLKAVGGDGVYHWSAEGFPDGLSIDPATGVISGTINVTGVVTFPAQFVIFATVTDGESPPQSSKTHFDLFVYAGPQQSPS